jgi:hypothetical protein
METDFLRVCLPQSSLSLGIRFLKYSLFFWRLFRRDSFSQSRQNFDNKRCFPVLIENQQMHQNVHFIVMSSQTILYVSACQRHHQGGHMILTNYLYVGVQLVRIIWTTCWWHWYVETCRSVWLDIKIKWSFWCISWFSIRIYTKMLGSNHQGCFPLSPTNQIVCQFVIIQNCSPYNFPSCVVKANTRYQQTYVIIEI